MIDPASASSLARIASRERDVMHAYQPGFVPESDDVAVPTRVVRDDDPLAVAAPEGAYFASAGPDGGIAFSRDGGFHMAGGRLLTADGRSVLGVVAGSRALVPLRVDAYDAALGRAADVRIDADGTLSYARTSVDPRTGERRSERVPAGRVALARFPAGTQPERTGAAYVRAPSGVTPLIGLPADSGFAPLATRARDLGRIDLLAGLEQMREAYVSYEALRAAQHARGGVDKTTLDLVK